MSTPLPRPPKLNKDDPKSYQLFNDYLLRLVEELKNEIEALKARLANGGL